MPLPFAGIALGAGLAGAGTSMITGWLAADAQKAAAMEQVRRQDRQNAATYSEATALSGASGVEATGSVQTYLAEMTNEFRRQHDWAVKQASQGADLSKLSSVLGGATSIGSSLFSFGAASGWGATPKAAAAAAPSYTPGLGQPLWRP